MFICIPARATPACPEIKQKDFPFQRRQPDGITFHADDSKIKAIIRDVWNWSLRMDCRNGKCQDETQDNNLQVFHFIIINESFSPPIAGRSLYLNDNMIDPLFCVDTIFYTTIAGLACFDALHFSSSTVLFIILC